MLLTINLHAELHWTTADLDHDVEVKSVEGDEFLGAYIETASLAQSCRGNAREVDT